MKAIIPLAGKGTRLRPHTHHIPKPLVRVGGRPVLAYILDDLEALGIGEVIFVVGHLRDEIRRFVDEEYPSLGARYVVQEVQDGTAGAVKLAEPFADDELLILFVDTLFDADLTLAQRLPEEYGGVLWAKEVEDYQRFGVIVTDDEGNMTRIVEKPSEPISRLANIGLYHIRDYQLLFEGINHVLDKDPGPGGEYYLTDAFQYMVDNGSRLRTAPVEGWYDCGKVETLLDTNRHLLGRDRGVTSQEALVDGTRVDELVRVEDGVEVRNSSIGPNVTLERGARVVNSRLQDTIVGHDAVIEDAELRNSLVGARAQVRNVRGRVNVGDDSEVLG